MQKKGLCGAFKGRGIVKGVGLEVLKFQVLGTGLPVRAFIGLQTENPQKP